MLARHQTWKKKKNLNGWQATDTTKNAGRLLVAPMATKLSNHILLSGSNSVPSWGAALRRPSHLSDSATCTATRTKYGLENDAGNPHSWIKNFAQESLSQCCHLGKSSWPQGSREGVWKHKYRDSSAGHLACGSVKAIRKLNTSHHLHEKTPAQTLPRTQKGSKTQRQVILQRLCIQTNSRRGEIPGERVCGLGFFSFCVVFC